MLDIMRRKKRLKAVLWLVIISLSMGMLLLFVPGGPGESGMETSAASVDGEAIPMQDLVVAYRRAVDNYRADGKNKTDPETLKSLGLGREALNSLIGVRVINFAAKKLGLEVTPDEIREAVVRHPSLQNNGAFIGIDQYKAMLAANNITVGEFEGGLKNMLLARKVRNVITDALDIPEKDLREEFIQANVEAQLSFVILKKENFKLPVAPTEAELRAYYEANKEKYRVKEQRRVQYLLLAIGDIASSIQVSDKDIQDEWTRQDRKETVTAAHILFQVPEGANAAKETEIREKAEEVLKRVRAGEDFADLAKKYSDDPGSKEQGGDLGSFLRGRMVKQFDDVAFSLKPGEVSGLVRTQFGYHIIKVLKHDVPSLDAERKNIARSLQIDRASNLAKQKAAEAQQLASTQNDLKVIEKALNVPSQIVETGFVDRDTNPFSQGISKSLLDEIFRLKEINSIGKAADHPYGYAIPKLLETKLPKPPDFNEARANVSRDYVNLKESELMNARAKDLARSASSLGDLEKAAQKDKLTVKTTPKFKMGSAADPEIGMNSQIENASFSLPVGAVSDPIPLSNGTGLVVLQVKSRTPFDEEAYKKQRENIRDRLFLNLQDVYFQEYLRRVTEDLEKAGKVRINPKALEQLAMYRS
jgi:peptidyl-prolyl cis-trans isomerase D